MANEIARLRSTVARLEGALAMLYRDVEFLIEDGTLPKDAANHPATMEARAAIAPAKGGEGP
jgi:hypothetical protein